MFSTISSNFYSDNHIEMKIILSHATPYVYTNIYYIIETWIEKYKTKIGSNILTILIYNVPLVKYKTHELK